MEDPLLKLFLHVYQNGDLENNFLIGSSNRELEIMFQF